MKFKVDAKDFFLFLLYCIILLYLCALAVANLFSLLENGTFYGLIPTIAFTKYLVITICLFLGMLIFIFTSVSSYIFNREKGDGVGLKINKDKASDGYSKWTKEKEMKNASKVVKIRPTDKELTAGGIPLISTTKEIWVDNGDYHNLVIGSTGSGKSESLVLPMVNILAKKGESMIITDPKGEIYTKTANNLKARGYKIIVLNFREPSKGNAWNPLDIPYKYYKEGNFDKATELLEDVSLNILYDPSKGNGDSEFWEKGSADYFSGLALGLFQDASEKEINLNSINYMSTVGEERYATSNFIKEYFTLKGKESNAYMFANTVINAPSDTKGGLLSTFSQKIRMFSTKDNLAEMLSYSDFDMRDIGKGKTAVFMIIHDEKKTYHTLMTIFIKQCYETLIDVAQSNGGKLQYRTNFILDEFPNMPPLKDVDSMVSAARSRDIRFTFIIQNFAQLNDVYGEEVAQVIRGNCGNLIYLISTELKALEEISKMCGEVKSKEKDKTASTPLVTVSDLQKLKMGEAIIIRLRMNPFKTKYAPNLKIDWGEEYPLADYPTREFKNVELFDLKKFVTEEKRKSMMNNPNQPQNPMMGGSNPFTFNPSSMGLPPISPLNGPSMGSTSSNPFGGGVQNMDIDAMMRDIDRKLKELDEEEARQKEKLKQQNKDLFTPKNDDIDMLLDDITLPKENKKIVAEHEDMTNEKEPEKEIIENHKEHEKPKLNVDVDSVIMNENVITDDEFFDDFFSDE